MGTTAHILVMGPDADTLLARAAARLHELERKWSRFLPNSEISRANALAGSHVVVSPETMLLVQRSVEGFARTRGSFDPTVLRAVRDAGYDRDFGSVRAAASLLDPPAPQPAPGCLGIEWDENIGAITFPRGVTFDPGGIGKGLAADLVSAELVELGARGALVNVGGDLRVRGDAPNGASWDVAIEHPIEPRVELLRVGLVDGAVATSSRARRHWRTAAGPAHHIVDPRTGRPSASRYVAVTAVAADSWWAEVVATAVFVDELGIDSGARFVTVDADGGVAFDPALVGVAA